MNLAGVAPGPPPRAAPQLTHSHIFCTYMQLRATPPPGPTPSASPPRVPAPAPSRIVLAPEFVATTKICATCYAYQGCSCSTVKASRKRKMHHQSTDPVAENRRHIAKMLAGASASTD